MYSKRLLFVLTTSLSTILLVVGSFLQKPFEIWGVLLVSLVLVFAVKWGLNLNPVLPPLLFLSTGFVQYLFPHTQLWFKLVFWLSHFAVFYLLLLSLNIFAVSTKVRAIPLLRPAKTTLFLVVVLIAFYGFSVILKGVPFVLFQAVLLAGFSFVLSFVLFTFFVEGVQTSVASLCISWLCLGAFLTLSFFPLKSFLRGLIISATFYVALSLGREYFAHRLDRRTIFEYFALILVLGAAVFWLGAR